MWLANSYCVLHSQACYKTAHISQHKNLKFVMFIRSISSALRNVKWVTNHTRCTPYPIIKSSRGSVIHFSHPQYTCQKLFLYGSSFHVITTVSWLWPSNKKWRVFHLQSCYKAARGSHHTRLPSWPLTAKQAAAVHAVTQFTTQILLPNWTVNSLERR